MKKEKRILIIKNKIEYCNKTNRHKKILEQLKKELTILLNS
jgi:hypothetical protein